MKIYLDYAASTPTKPEVVKAIQPYYSTNYGNPSSVHSFGQETRKAVDEAREKIAQFLNCEPAEVIFTSGATESDNLAIKGVVESLNVKMVKLGSEKQSNKATPDASVGIPTSDVRSERRENQQFNKPHIITSQIEHHAVLHTCESLEKQGKAQVTFLPVDRDGRVSVESVQKAIKPNTVLVSIMYANNETGIIQPIREIGKMIEKENRNRMNQCKMDNVQLTQKKPNINSLYINHYILPHSPILFHTDAVQAVNYLNCNTKYLHVDLLSLSGHKIGAPKGIGALFIKKGIPITPQILGGAHEYGKRAGTENITGIVALGVACSLINSRRYGRDPDIRGSSGQSTSSTNSTNLSQFNSIQHLRDSLEKSILKTIPDTKINGDPKNRLPNITNISFEGVEGESILLSLDMEGIAVSTGSACTSGSLEPSHVIMAMFNDAERTHGSIRFSLGWATKKQEIDYVLKKLPPIIKRLREFSPTYKK